MDYWKTEQWNCERRSKNIDGPLVFHFSILLNILTIRLITFFDSPLLCVLIPPVLLYPLPVLWSLLLLRCWRSVDG